MNPGIHTSTPTHASAFGLPPTETAPIVGDFREIRAAVERLETLLHRAQLDIERHQEIAESSSTAVRHAFGELMVRLDDALADTSGHDRTTREELGAWVQRQLMPYLMMSDNAKRWLTKPRGYAGDFLSIEWVYRNEARGAGPIGELLDRCFLDVPAAKAVRNRRTLMLREIERTVAACERPVARITSMACGPARELFDVYPHLDRPQRLESTLIDIDEQALEFVSGKAEDLGLGERLALHRANLIYLALGRHSLDLAPQDLVYSIGLIDYLDDNYVVRLLDYVHSILAPGGRVILGNFHPCNQTKAMMDYILEWRLIHRDEEDMDRLFKASAFGTACREIQYEDEGINLFAVGVK